VPFRSRSSVKRIITAILIVPSGSQVDPSGGILVALHGEGVVEYRCLLISPGDVDQERAAVVEAIESWNALVGAALDGRVHLVRRETHGVPDASGPPRQVLSRQIVDECDFGIAIFWTRIGTETTTHPSGSIYEIERLRERGVVEKPIDGEEAFRKLREKSER